MAEIVEQKDKNPLPKKILSIVGNVLFYAIIAVLFLFSLMNINQGSKNGGFPNIFGRGFLSVKTDSMEHSGVNKIPDYYEDYDIGEIHVGDLVNVKVLKTQNLSSLKVGDVCTFYDESLKALNTHRIVYITYEDDGSIALITFQGDKSVMNYGKYDPSDSSKATNNSWLLGQGEIQQFSSTNWSNIKGIVTSVKSGAGKVLENIQSNWLWYFVIPVAVLLLAEVFFVVKNIMDLRGEKQKVALAADKEAMMADLEAEKEKMRQELLAELKAQSENTEASKEETPAETPNDDAPAEEPKEEEPADKE